MATNPREWTCKLLEALENGILDAGDVITMCMNQMSEDDVQDMCESNDLEAVLGMEDAE